VRQRTYCLLLLIATLSLSVLLAFEWLPSLSRAPVAFAHTFVIGSDPVDGSTVSTAPTVVRIFFNEEISSASIAYVFTPDGHIVDSARSSIPATNPRELDTRLITPGELPQGGYTVRWTALANDDGYTTHGVIGFNIGHSSVGLPGQTILGPSTSNILPQLDLLGILMVAWDWLVLLALTFWVGILAVGGLVVARSESEQASSRATHKGSRRESELYTDTSPTLIVPASSIPLQWLCLVALLVGEFITFILRATFLTQGLGGSGIDLGVLRQLVIETSYGHLWLVSVVCIGIALGLLWWTTRGQDSADNTLGTRRPKGRFSHPRQQVAQEAGTTLLDEDAKKADVEESSTSSVSATAGGVGLPRWYTIVGLALAGLILLTMAFSSDEAQLAQPHASAVVLNWLYLVAQSLWFGGLACLGYVLLPLLPVDKPDHRGEVLASLLQRLTRPMLAIFGILLVSGLFLSESSLTSTQQLINDPYGRALLVKLILIILMFVLSVYTLFVIRPHLARQALLLPVVEAELPARRVRQSALQRTERRLKQSLAIQSWLGGGVLLCAALMAFYAPPIVFPAANYTSAASTNAASPATTTNAQTQKVGNLSVTLQVLPGRVDYANTVVITINDSDGNPVINAQVQLSTDMELMDMGTAHATVKGGNPTYIAVFNKDAAFSMFGVWDIGVRIERPNQAPVQTVFKVTLAG
jgi:putative copper export protein/methionine-rich copper-binding protein CopC